MSRIIKFAFSFRHAPLKHFMYLEKLESEATLGTDWDNMKKFVILILQKNK